MRLSGGGAGSPLAAAVVGRVSEAWWVTRLNLNAISPGGALEGLLNSQMMFGMFVCPGDW